MHETRMLLIKMLTQENAHATIEQALKNISIEDLGAKEEDFPYSIWQLAEHIRITQNDIVEFSYNPKHVSPSWPEEFWPKNPSPENLDQLQLCLNQILKDRNKMAELINDNSIDLYKPFSYGSGQNLLRVTILLIDHTSYHTGQIILLRKLLGSWE